MALNKRQITDQINRYMTLLSNLRSPDTEYLSSLDYLKGLVQASNKDELPELERTWEQLKPRDARSLDYIEQGKLDG